jgi:hypothetical protein
MLRAVDAAYNGGGAGYILNAKVSFILWTQETITFMVAKQALELFVQNVHSNPDCFSKQTISAEDVLMSVCLSAIGIKPVDTRESSTFDNIKRERFHWKLPFEEHEATDSTYRYNLENTNSFNI